MTSGKVRGDPPAALGEPVRVRRDARRSTPCVLSSRDDQLERDGDHVLLEDDERGALGQGVERRGDASLDRVLDRDDGEVGLT